MGEPRRFVIGTAGHIDHGKTSLVRALTGVDCDRLAEEKRRGITIELGFATWPLPGGATASIVDVPGHEGFVDTMAAGAAGLDLVMLVVDATEGVMPQTREHLAIASLLGITRGVIALTKRDLVDDDVLALAVEEAREAVVGSFLAGAPLLPCSATTGAGLLELGEEVQRQLDEVPARPASGPAFLPVDRVFTKAGFGTVATGTLLRGALAVGDELEALPGRDGDHPPRLKVRALQVQGASVERAEAGARVAVNARGDGARELGRGVVLATAGGYQASRALLVEVEPALLGDAAHALLALLGGEDGARRRCGQGPELSLLLGTSRRRARLTVLEGGSPALARLLLDEPVASFSGQRFVLRQPGLRGPATVAGGRVLDPLAPRGRGAVRRSAALGEALLAGSSAAGGPGTSPAAARRRALALVEDARERGLPAPALAARLPPGEDAAALAEALVARGKAVLVGGALVAARFVDEAADEVRAVVASFHRERPVVAGPLPGEVQSRLSPLRRPLAELAMARLMSKGTLVREGRLVRLKWHTPASADLGDRLAAATKRYEEAGLKAPLDEEVRAALDMPPAPFKDLLNELKRRGTLVRLTDNMHVARSALEDLRARVVERFAQTGELRVADLKELFGLTRKHAIPMLEWLDEQKVTARRGDVRVPGRAGRVAP